jgi:uncharacterized membrane protein YeiH
MPFDDLISYLGVAVAAVSGALAAGRRGYDLIGVIVLAVVTATGGGTLRDLLMDRHPVFWVKDPTMLFVIFAAAGLTIAYTRFRRPPWMALLVADALTLAYFTIFGAYVAEQKNLQPIVVVVMATITGAAGGVLRDVLCRETPLLFQRSETLYATAAVAGAVLYLSLNHFGVPPGRAALLGMAAVALVRFASVRWGWRLPAYRI